MPVVWVSLDFQLYHYYLNPETFRMLSNCSLETFDKDHQPVLKMPHSALVLPLLACCGLFKGYFIWTSDDLAWDVPSDIAITGSVPSYFAILLLAYFPPRHIFSLSFSPSHTQRSPLAHLPTETPCTIPDLTTLLGGFQRAPRC